MPSLSAATATAYATCAMQVLQTPYPYAMQHLTMDAQDRPRPDAVHPVFWGSYDWHSSVHMHWSLARLLHFHPTLAERAAIEAHFRKRFTVANIAKELAYCQRFTGFERPYGWAWLLALWQTLLASDIPTLRRAGERIEPLACHFLSEWRNFLRVSHYPQRAGTHANSAFAMVLSLRAARAANDRVTAKALMRAATKWLGTDTKYPAQYEPSGCDFLSPGLCEALLMSEAQPAQFAAWWRRFAPAEIASWQQPAKVGSRLDGQLVHLDGLNLSRAWCLRLLAERVPSKSTSAMFRSSAQRHLRAALPHVTGGDFIATHWLVSFALLALCDAVDTGI